MQGQTFRDVEAARVFAADVDNYGWTTARRLYDIGVRPLADGDVSELGVLRARIANSEASAWRRLEDDVATMRDDLRVSVAWYERQSGFASDEGALDLMRFEIRWHGVAVDAVDFESQSRPYLPVSKLRARNPFVTIWEHAAGAFFDRLTGAGTYDQVFARSGIVVRKSRT